MYCRCTKTHATLRVSNLCFLFYVRGLTSKTSPQTHMVGVYRPQQSSEAGPDHYVSREVARRLVADGLGSWINSSRGVRLLSLRHQLADESSRMSDKTTQAFMEGSLVATARVEGWR